MVSAWICRSWWRMKLPFNLDGQWLRTVAFRKGKVWSIFMDSQMGNVWQCVARLNKTLMSSSSISTSGMSRTWSELMYCLQMSDIFSLVWCFYIEVTWSCWRSSGLCTWVNEQVLFFFSFSSPSSMSPCSKSCEQEDSHTHLSLTYIKVLCLTAFSMELWADHQPIDTGTHTTTSRTQNSEHMTTQNIVTILHWS
jgi:hypothetical protein